MTEPKTVSIRFMTEIDLVVGNFLTAIPLKFPLFVKEIATSQFGWLG